MDTARSYGWAVCEGMKMGFLSKLTKAVLSVAVTPVDILVDVVTFGGVLDDRSEPRTVERLKKASKALNDSIEDIGEGKIL